MAQSKKTIEEKYTSMTEREHIIRRSGMYVGNTSESTKQEFIYDNDEDNITIQNVTFSDAMLKLFDEVLSNSCDEYRRIDNMGLTKIDVIVNKSNNEITIKDNGGIPIKKHKDAGMYVPEFIFGQLRTSSNYDDSENRIGVGTNGLGAVLANIFSKKFNVISSDSKNKIDVLWSNNMTEKSNPVISKCKDHFTQISFIIDFDKFEQTEYGLTDDFVKMIQKRCIDAAAANPVSGGHGRLDGQRTEN